MTPKVHRKVTLIPNWKDAWRFASIRWSVLGVIVMSVLEAVYQGWVALPPQVADRVPNAPMIALVIYICVMIGRLYKVTKEWVDDDDQEDPAK